MKKIAITIVSALLAATLLAGCDGSNSVKNKIPPFPVSVNNVTVEKAPKAVASLSPVITNMLTDLGYTAKIVGFSTGEVLPEIPVPEPVVSEPEGFRWFWEKEEPVVSEPAPVLPSGEIGTALKPDLEKIGEYMPEVVFTTLPLPKMQMDKLDAVNIKVVVMPAANTIEELKTNYISIIKIMSGLDEADTIGAALMEETQRQLDYIVSVVPEPKLSYLYVSTIDPLIATGDTYESNLLSLLGTNAAGEYVDYTVTAEQLAALQPDVILFSNTLNKENIVQSELFKDKTAVAADKLIAIDPVLLTDRSKDVAESVRTLAKLLYPDVDFEEPVPATSSEESK